MNPALDMLGLAPESRAAIIHVDDVGMCHGANQAYLDLSRVGAVTSGSVMVPCPWFPELAAAAADESALDLGVHLTLTCEWPGYRWRPLTTAAPSSGLVDGDGYCWRTVALLAEHVVPEAAEIELRAQIDRALAAGIDATHLDTHMGAAAIPSLLEIYVRLGRDYRLPILLPRRPEDYFHVLKMDNVDTEPYRKVARDLESQGMPLVDDFRMTPGVPSAESDATYKRLVETLPPGLTFVALHPNMSGDIEAIVPPRAHFRTDEYRILKSGAFAAWLEENDIRTVGYRPLRDALRERWKM
jgi:chitin disaccharide deacetylase